MFVRKIESNEITSKPDYYTIHFLLFSTCFRTARTPKRFLLE